MYVCRIGIFKDGGGKSPVNRTRNGHRLYLGLLMRYTRCDTPRASFALVTMWGGGLCLLNI